MDKLAEFFKSDTCLLLRNLIRTRMANSGLNAIENIVANSHEVLGNNSVSSETVSLAKDVARYAISIEVLEEIRFALLNPAPERPVAVTSKITIEEE